MKLSRPSIIPIVFVILSVASTVYVVSATVNYLHFFPALGTLQVQATQASFSQSQKTLQVHVVATNPSDYSGIQLSGASIRISFYDKANQTTTLFETTPFQSNANFNRPDLSPQGRAYSDIIINLTPENTSQIVDFAQRHSGAVNAHMLLTVDFTTFLTSFTATRPTVTQDLPLTLV